MDKIHGKMILSRLGYREDYLQKAGLLFLKCW